DMSETFEGYERQYCELSASLSKKCTSATLLDGGEDINGSVFLQVFMRNINGNVYSANELQSNICWDGIDALPRIEQKKQKISEVQAGIDQAESLIRKMDVEARSLPPNVKAVLLAKLREYKSDLNNLKSEIKRIASTNLNQAARDELLESGLADAETVSADQRGRLLKATERLNKSSDRVRDSRRTMLETEELGVSLLQDLHQQRQSLLNAHGNVMTLTIIRYSAIVLIIVYDLEVALWSEQKKQKILEVQAGIDEDESLIRKMGVKARSLPPNVQAVLLAKLREYKSDLNNLKSEIKRVSSTTFNQAARDELLKSGLADATAVSADQRGSLLKATED
ncbi:vesicle transport v-SNARE 13-like protein, partial [Tanacetum coccineum]